MHFNTNVHMIYMALNEGGAIKEGVISRVDCMYQLIKFSSEINWRSSQECY